MGKRIVSIHIGQLHASKNPTIIYTLLGSCVAVCLFDPLAKIGGMNHILIPGYVDYRSAGVAGRYSENAIAMLIKRILHLGGDPEQLEAKIFGGANMFRDMSSGYGTGMKNAENVIACLRQREVPIVNQDVGGTDTRKIYFHTDTGDVFLKRVEGTRFK